MVLVLTVCNPLRALLERIFCILWRDRLEEVLGSGEGGPPGRHILAIKLRGRHVRGSPFTVHVSPGEASGATAGDVTLPSLVQLCEGCAVGRALVSRVVCRLILFSVRSKFRDY